MKIKSIKRVPARMVYAIKTSSGTFISDGLAHHNCAHCNIFNKDKAIIQYTLFMVKTYGPQVLDEIEEVRIKGKDLKYSRSDYMELIEKYKKKTDQLSKKEEELILGKH